MLRSTALAVALLLGAAAPAVAAPDQREDVVALTNAERAKAGCPALKRHTALDKAAQEHSADMAAKNYFSHTGLDGSSPGARMQRAGYPRNAGWGENISAGRADAAATVTGWMNSAGHRRNILNCAYKSIGVGYSANPAAKYRHYWVQNFGTV